MHTFTISLQIPKRAVEDTDERYDFLCSAIHACVHYNIDSTRKESGRLYWKALRLCSDINTYVHHNIYKRAQLGPFKSIVPLFSYTHTHIRAVTSTDKKIVKGIGMNDGFVQLSMHTTFVPHNAGNRKSVQRH